MKFMYGAKFTITSWMGEETHVFAGANAKEILAQLNEVQSLECLARMGAKHETDSQGKANIVMLEKLLDKYYSDTLIMDDIAMMAVCLSIGTIKCHQVVEGEDAVRRLQDHK